MKKHITFTKELSIQSVSEEQIPSYPQLHDLQQALNEADTHSTWLREPLSAGVVMALFLGQGSWALSASPVKAGADEVNGQDASSPSAKQIEKEVVKNTIAPIFFHGEGSGATGCVVISPPAFMTEDEALDIIMNELNQAGFHFERRDVLLDGVFSKERGDYIDANDDRNRHPFFFDLYDKQHQIGIKFVSKVNYEALGGFQESSTAHDLDFIEVAQGVRELLHGLKKTHVGIFYDPLTDESGSMDLLGNDLPGKKGDSQEGLKAQAQEFIIWLKGQGLVAEVEIK